MTASSTKSQRISLIDKLDYLLPQTQCGKCGYSGCRPYAEAISAGEQINQCPPGGDKTIAQLAHLLERPVEALSPKHGVHGEQLLARIREEECIGCTKCIQVCPVDAILGAAKLMHTVLESECSGCDLCLDPCPVDCIDMIPPTSLATKQSQQQRDLWRSRHEYRQQRLSRELFDHGTASNTLTTRRITSETTDSDSEPPTTGIAIKPAPLSRISAQQDIADAVARVKTRQANRIKIKISAAQKSD